MKVSALTSCSAVSDLCLLVFVYLTGRLQIVNRYKLTENPKRIKSENVQIKWVKMFITAFEIDENQCKRCICTICTMWADFSDLISRIALE